MPQSPPLPIKCGIVGRFVGGIYKLLLGLLRWQAGAGWEMLPIYHEDNRVSFYTS
jgi:hypothetical protein